MKKVSISNKEAQQSVLLVVQQMNILIGQVLEI